LRIALASDTSLTPSGMRFARRRFRPACRRYDRSKRRAEKRERIPPYSKAYSPCVPDYRRTRVPGGTFFFKGQLARPSLRSVGDANSRAGGRCSAGAAPRALPHRRLGRPSRPYALPVDLSASRCRLPRSLARGQDGILESFAGPRVPITGHDQPRRNRHLAAAVLGAHDPR
jgi:hypothetical protein